MSDETSDDSFFKVYHLYLFLAGILFAIALYFVVQVSSFTFNRLTAWNEARKELSKNTPLVLDENEEEEDYKEEKPSPETTEKIVKEGVKEEIKENVVEKKAPIPEVVKPIKPPIKLQIPTKPIEPEIVKMKPISPEKTPEATSEEEIMLRPPRAEVQETNDASEDSNDNESTKTRINLGE